jgi:hypothetical protein
MNDETQSARVWREACEEAIAAATQRACLLAAALEPFVKAFEREIKTESEFRRKWNEQMPEHWPIQITVKMADCRTAKLLLEPSE